jgi:hypothetical protein
MVSNVSFSVFAIATAIKYGTPLPIILNFFDKQSVGSTRNFLGKD